MTPARLFECHLLSRRGSNNSSGSVAVPVLIISSGRVDDMAAHLIFSMLIAGDGDLRVRSRSGTVFEPCVILLRDDDDRNASQHLVGYHRNLRRKMRLLTQVVLAAVSPDGIRASSAVRPRTLLLIDADAQVFRGWFSGVIIRALHWSPVPTLRFQREASAKRPGLPDRINSGVVLLSAATPATAMRAAALFCEANSTLEEKKGGDQTAIQRVLRWHVDAPPGSSNNERVDRLVAKWRDAVPALEAVASQLSSELEQAAALTYGVFSKVDVNAGVVPFQQEKVLIHHAHMSGAHKRKTLATAWRLRYGNGTAAPFLDKGLAACGPDSGDDNVRFVCDLFARTERKQRLKSAATTTLAPSMPVVVSGATPTATATTTAATADAAPPPATPQRSDAFLPELLALLVAVAAVVVLARRMLK